MYLAIKHLHILFVALSGAGFALRGAWMLRGSPLLRHRLARVVPHFVDSALLASAVALAVMSSQYPFVFDWLTAKVCGLLVYIVLGALALRGRSYGRRAVAFVAAVLVYAWIVSVALSRQPAGFLAWV